MFLEALVLAFIFKASGSMVPGHLPFQIAPSREELYPIALSCLIWGQQWKGKKLLIHCDNQSVVDIWAKGPPVTPSSCTLSGQSSFALHPTNFLFLFPIFVAQMTQLLTLCPVFRFPGFSTLLLRQTWSQLQFLFRPKSSGRSSSLSTVSSYCTLHTPCVPSWNSQVHYLLPL